MANLQMIIEKEKGIFNQVGGRRHSRYIMSSLFFLLLFFSVSLIFSLSFSLSLLIMRDIAREEREKKMNV